MRGLVAFWLLAFIVVVFIVAMKSNGATDKPLLVDVSYATMVCNPTLPARLRKSDTRRLT